MFLIHNCTWDNVFLHKYYDVDSDLLLQQLYSKYFVKVDLAKYFYYTFEASCLRGIAILMFCSGLAKYRFGGVIDA